MKSIIDFILQKSKKPIDIEMIYQLICSKQDEEPFLSLSDKKEIEEVLSRGVEDYEYYMTPNGRYTLLSKTSFRTGIFYGNRAGEGVVNVITSYVNREGEEIVKEEKFSISKGNCNHAIDGDFVLIDIGGNGKKPKVDRILERNLENIIGEITRLGAQFFVTPMDKKKQGLMIALEGEDYIEGQIVSVSLGEERSSNFYVGKITREFSHKDDPHADALFEAFKCGMPEGFSESSLKQLEHIPSVVRPEDKVGRVDFTNWEVFSIDGADTKDKDDCISFKQLPNGNYLLGVHIADVPYYVSYGSAIDKDAFRKGTSYYFGGCVEPMLPRKLSNGICSLNDGVERLTKTILIEYTKDGEVVSRSLVPGVIRSQIGMTYDKVNAILKEGKVAPGYEPYVDTLKKMANFASVLKKNRIRCGAIEFNRPEIKFLHDENGNACDVILRHQDVAENLIEEFMLAGNVNVLDILNEAGIPCVFRNHDAPNLIRLQEFLRLLEVIEIPFEYTAEDICKDRKIFQLLAKHIQNRGHLTPMLNDGLIKCMAHASYGSHNIGHYGAGFWIYGHFTSPIRRLADFAISRIIDECYFEKDESKRRKAIRKWNALSYDFSVQASKMERLEETVEKNVKYLDTAVYLSRFVGQEFEGIITSVGSNSLVIQLDNLLEGRVKVSSLPGDYVTNSETFTLLSLSDRDNYYIGDRLKLRLADVNQEFKTVDFSVIEKIRENRIDDFANSNQNVKKKAYQNRFQKG